MAEWHEPRTWQVGEIVTDTWLNEQIRDNENWLKQAIDEGLIPHGNAFPSDPGAPALFWRDDLGQLYLRTGVDTWVEVPVGAARVLALLNTTDTLKRKGAEKVRRDGVAHYRNVVHIVNNGSPHPVTGTLQIAMPTSKLWSNTMLWIRVVGYEYSGANRGRSWELLVGGYNYTGAPAWYHYFAYIRGRAPFSQVRLADNGTRNVILLGDTSTDWYYSKIVVADVIAGQNNYDDWDTGWSIDWITDESAIQHVATPAIDIILTTGGHLNTRDGAVLNSKQGYRRIEVASGSASAGDGWQNLTVSVTWDNAFSSIAQVVTEVGGSNLEFYSQPASFSTTGASKTVSSGKSGDKSLTVRFLGIGT